MIMQFIEVMIVDVLNFEIIKFIVPDLILYKFEHLCKMNTDFKVRRLAPCHGSQRVGLLN